MSKIRAVALSAALLVGLAGVSEAQGEGRRERGAPGMRHGGARHGQLMRDLNLTEAQRTRIFSIRDKYLAQRRAIQDEARRQFRQSRPGNDTSAAARGADRAQREQFRQRLGTLREQEHAEIRAVLTTDQRARFDAARVDGKKRMDGRRERTRRGRPMRIGT